MRIRANGIDIEIEVKGPEDGDPLLLIMGLGMQLIAWPDAFVDLLVSHGFRVIRFDNRDAGLSQGFDAMGVPNVLAASLRYSLRLPVRSPYSLDDMADDGFGVLDAVGVSSAHVVGASLGGMVAQTMAFTAPERVRSLGLIMTTSGSRRLPQASLRVRGALMKRLPAGSGVAERVAHLEDVLALIGSPAFRPGPGELRARVERSVMRAWRPAGTMRQLLAVAAHGDRSRKLRRIVSPTVVIHGEQDPLVPVAAAHDLARKIAGARLDVIEGMGHDLPAPLLDRLARDVVDNARRT